MDLAIAKEIEADPVVTNIAIGAKLHLDRETVAKRRNRPEFRSMYAERNMPAVEYLRAFVDRASRVYGLLLKTVKDEDSGEEIPLHKADVVARVCENLLGIGRDQSAAPSGGQAAIPGELAAALTAYFQGLAAGAGPGGGTHQRGAGRAGNRRSLPAAHRPAAA